MFKSKKLINIIICLLIAIILSAGLRYIPQKVVKAEGAYDSTELSERIKKYINNDEVYTSYINGTVKETELIAFHEVGFNRKDSKRLKYHFYLYVPKSHTLSQIQKDIEMRVWNNKVTLLSGQIIERNDKDRFYLLEMDITSEDDRKHIIDVGIEKGYREYVFGYIPWRYEGKDYTPELIDRKYIYKGYEEGLDETSIGKSTLTATCEKTRYLNLDVRSVTYTGGLVDYNARFQLFSVYFSIPKHLTDTYGYLKKVEASFYETLLENVMITDDQDIYNDLKEYIDNGYKSVSEAPIGSKFLANAFEPTEYQTDVAFFDLGYAKEFYKKKYGTNYKYTDSQFRKFSMVYKRKFDNEYKISAEEIKKDLPKNLKEVPQMAQTAEDENGERKSSGFYQFEYENGEPIKTTTLGEKTTAFQRFWHFGFKKPDVSTKVDFDRRIVKVEDDIYDNNADEKYKVDKSYLEDLRKYYSDSKQNSKDTYLLRYAVRKVRWENFGELRRHELKKSIISDIREKGIQGKHSGGLSTNYGIKLPVFLDFNIISLTFFNKTGETKIYTISKHINHVPDMVVPIKPSVVPKIEKMPSKFSKIFKILGATVGVLLFVGAFVGVMSVIVNSRGTGIKKIKKYKRKET